MIFDHFGQYYAVLVPYSRAVRRLPGEGAVDALAAVYGYEEPVIWLFFKALEAKDPELIDICLSGLEEMDEKVQNLTPIIITATDGSYDGLEQRARRFLRNHHPTVENLFRLLSLSDAIWWEKGIGDALTNRKLISWFDSLLESYIDDIGLGKDWTFFGVKIPEDILSQCVQRVVDRIEEGRRSKKRYDFFPVALSIPRDILSPSTFYRAHYKNYIYRSDGEVPYDRDDFIEAFSERLAIFCNDYDIVRSLKGPINKFDADYDLSELVAELDKFSQDDTKLENLEELLNHSESEKDSLGRRWEWIGVFRIALSMALNHKNPQIRQVALHVLHRIREYLPEPFEVVNEELFTYLISAKTEDPFVRLKAIDLGTDWKTKRDRDISIFNIETHPEALTVDLSDKEQKRALAKRYHPDKNPGDKRAEEIFKAIFSQDIGIHPLETRRLEKEESKVFENLSIVWSREMNKDTGINITVYPIATYINAQPYLIGMKEKGREKSFFTLHLGQEGEKIPKNSKVFTYHKFRLIEEEMGSLIELLKDKDCILADISPWDACKGICSAFDLSKEEKRFLFGKLVIGSIAGGKQASETQRAITDGEDKTALVRWDLSARLRMKERPIIHISECPSLMQLFFSIGVRVEDKKRGAYYQYQPVLNDREIRNEDTWKMTNFHNSLKIYNNAIIKQALENFTMLQNLTIEERERFIYHLTETCREDEQIFKSLDVLHDIARGIFVNETDADFGKMAIKAFEIVHEAIALRYALDTLTRDRVATREDKLLQIELIRLFGFHDLLYFVLYDKDIEIRKKALESALVLGSNNKKAIEPLINVGGRARESVIDALKDEELRQGAIDALARIGEPSVNFLIKRLGQGNRKIREAASVALTRIGNPAVPRLLRALDGYTYYLLRTGIVEVLGNIGDERAINRLTTLANIGPHPRTAIAASEALAKMGVEHGFKVLIERMAQFERAAEALVRRGEPAVKYLIEALVDEERDFRPKKAAKVLVKIGEPAVEELIPALDHKNFNIRRKVHDVLVKIGKPAYRYLKEASKNGGIEVRVGVARVFRDIGDEQSIVTLTEMKTGDEADWVRTEARYALWDIERATSRSIKSVIEEHINRRNKDKDMDL